MKKVILGDTIVFTTTLHETDDTAITSGAVNLDVTDSSGSLVLSENIAHTTTGTYSETKSTVGWALGPIRQNWTAKTTGGTQSFIGDNEVKIVNAGTPFQTYVFESELESYFSDIRDYLDNQSEDQVIAAYKYTNRLLDGLGYHTPVKKNDDGFYDQSVRDYNAWDAIYRIVKNNQINQVDRGEEPWYFGFKDERDMVYNDWKAKKVTFKNKTSPSEAGVGPSSRTQGSSVGTMLTNHDEVYGNGFSGADFRRTWSVEITGTGTSGGVRECAFKWDNDGMGTLTGTTSDGWIHLDSECYVRFNMGTSTGTEDIFVVGDKWTWETNPVRNQTGGRNIAKGY